MIKGTILVALVLWTIVAADPMKNCFDSANDFKDSIYAALEKKDLMLVIDQLQKVFESYPSLLQSCGDQDKAKVLEDICPQECSKVLSKQAKTLVKIMRLYAEDRQKNQQAIAIYSVLFETTYKTQVQKKCPFLQDFQMMKVEKKGQCAEGMYQLSLVFQKLDNDLAQGKFNNSLTDMGKVIEKVPETLDSCSQPKMAKWVRTNFPKECLDAVGTLIREIDTLEHNYTHIEWLKKHFKDFTTALLRVKAACPALAH